MTRIIICAIIAGIMSAILAVIEQQAGLNLAMHRTLVLV